MTTVPQTQGMTCTTLCSWMAPGSCWGRGGSLRSTPSLPEEEQHIVRTSNVHALLQSHAQWGQAQRPLCPAVRNQQRVLAW